MGPFSKSDERDETPRESNGNGRGAACRTCGFTHPETDCPRWPAQHDDKSGRGTRRGR